MPDKDDQQEKVGLKQLVEHDAWGIVERKFWEHINDLQSIKNLDQKEDLKTQIMAREAAIEYMKDLYRDITGDVEELNMDMHNRQERLQDGGYGNDERFVTRSSSS
jgi:hypothetical protein